MASLNNQKYLTYVLLDGLPLRSLLLLLLSNDLCLLLIVKDFLYSELSF